LSNADPEPALGVTTSHGDADEAVHVTVPVPDCEMRIVCVLVFDAKAAPVVTALNASAVRSTVIVGIVDERTKSPLLVDA
jgi:hypothetical protein